MASSQKRKETVEVVVEERVDGKSIFKVVGKESGEKRIVGKNGDLHISCNDEDVAAFNSCTYYMSVLTSFGLAEKFTVVSANNVKKVVVDENRRVESINAQV